MAISRFDVVRPTSLDEAIEQLNLHGDQAQVIAGGTDLLRDIRLELKKPSVLVSLDRLEELVKIQEEDDGSIVIGPLTTMARLSRSPLVRDRLTALSEAAGWMGSPQVRNRATFGGNLCNARPCADTAPPAIVLKGVLVLKGPKTVRHVKAGGFMTGPGQTNRNPAEILESIRFPIQPENSGSAFITVTNRKALEITITSAAAFVSLDDQQDTIEEVRICLGSVAPTPLRAPTAEAALQGQPATQENLAKAAVAAVGDSSPIDDLRGSASYRRWMVEVLVARALDRALSRARGGAQ